MENTRRRRSGGLRNIITAVFAVAFVASIVSTITAFAAANLFKIQNAELSELSTTAEGSISSFDEENIVSSVTFHKLDDSAKYTITLKNTDIKDHIIESITDDNINPYISYEYGQHTGEQIDAGSDFVFVITAKYSAAITDIDQRAQVSNVKFFIHFTDIEEEILIVPNTGASSNTGNFIRFSVLSLVISATGLTIAGIFALKKHKKASKYIVAGIVTVAAIATTATVKAVTVEINSFTISTDITLKDKLVVTYTDKNGDEQELIVNYGEPANIPNQNKDGYTLTGWEDEQGNPVDPTQPITEDIKIHPIYRTHTYTIKFNGNGANGEMADLAMAYDEAKTLPTNAFDFPGRTYTGWDTEANGSGVHYDNEAEVKNLTAEDNGIVTLYAQWSINPFHIDYDGNGATSGDMATTNCEYDQACELRDNAFEKTGYHFIGWKYNNNDYANKADVKNIIESGTITMVAQWEVNHYTIIFDINTDDSNAAGDMADMTNLEYDHDYTLTANAFTRTGYNFGGWNTEIDGRNFGLTDAQEFHNLTTTDNAVITLYAQWNPIHYTIAFHQNSDGVAGSMSSQVFTYDEAKNLTQNAFIKNHYKFMGWTTVANGTGTKYDDQASIFNLTTEDGTTIDLYAQWKERTAYLKGTVNNSWGSAGDIIRSLPGYANATAFRHYEDEPNFDEIETKYNMAISSSNFPVYTWIDGETIYWWSEAETIYAHEDSRNFFSGLAKAETIEYSAFDFSLTKNIQGFFRNTAALSTIDLSPLAAANPTTLKEMFYGSGIASVDLSPLNTANATDMSGMFEGAPNIKTVDLSQINTSSVTTMAGMFRNATSFESVDFSRADLSSVTSLSEMFRNDKSLQNVSFAGVNTPNLKSISGMFWGAKIPSLDLSDLDTDNITSISYIFAGADIESLNVANFNTSKIAGFGGVFMNFNGHGMDLDLSGWTSEGVTGQRYEGFYESFSGAKVASLDISGLAISEEVAPNAKFEHTFFGVNSYIQTIYTNTDFITYNKNPDENYNGILSTYGTMSVLVGGAGTQYNYYADMKDYARIDDPDNGKPGIFTLKDARYVRYHDNDGDDTNNEANYTLMPSYYVSTAEPYDVKLRTNAFEKEHYKFMGWATSADGEAVYADGAALEGVAASKNPLDLYAVWRERTAVLDTGSNVNAALLSVNANTTAFEHYSGTPNLNQIDGEQDIALATSNFPVYVWTADNKTYWWSEAEDVYMNQTSSQMFADLNSVESIDLRSLNTSNVQIMGSMFQNDYALTSINVSEIDTRNVTSMAGMFIRCTSLATLDFSKFDTSKVENMQSMFKETAFTELDLSDWNTSSLTNAITIFPAMPNLEKLDLSGWDFSKLNHAFSRVIAEHSQPGKYPAATVSKPKTIILDDAIFPTDMSNAFMNNSYGIMSRLEGISLDNVDTTRVNNMSGMFQGATSLTSLDLTGFDFDNVRNMSKMFYKASALETITFANDIDTGSATNMASMFNEATSLSNVDVSHFNTEKVENMNGMFRFTPNLTNVDVSNFSTDSLKGSLESLFSYNGAAVLDLSGWDTSRVTIMRNLFLRNTAVTTIYASDSFDVSNVATEGTDDDGAFQHMSSNLVGGAGTVFSGLTPTNLTYARIDDPDNGEPGFFTIKGARYIRYNGNGADNATPYGTMTSEYLKASDSLKKNAFTRGGYVFTGWKDADNNEYTDEQVMTNLTESKTPLELYAQWKEKSSTLQSGTNINQIMRNLNADATSFRRFPGTPTATTLENAQLISVNESSYPAYMWNDGNTLYWWSEAEKVYLSNGSSFFNNMQKLETIDVAGLDTSKVKVMRQMFMNCYALTSLDLSTFNTSAVTDMANMFSNDASLTSLNVTSFDTSKVGQMNGIFQGFAGEVLDLSSFDTSSVGGNVIAFFSTTNNLKTVYVGDKWNATNVDIPSTTPLVGGAGSTSGGARLDDPDNNSRGRLSKKGARYIRYHDNDGDTANDEANYALMTSHYLKAGDSLKKNAFTRNGYVFTGWKDADNNEYTDEQVMTGLTESKTPLELYAQWDAASYIVTFNANGGEVLQSTKTVTYLQSYGELPTPVKYDYANSILGGKYSFKEWNTKADGSGDTITSSSIYENTDDTTLYAIWNGQFTVTVYNGESETPTTASYGTDNIVYLNAQDVAGKQFLYWEVDGAKKAYNKNYSMRMFQGKDLTIRAIYGSESDLESQQPGTYISDIYRQYSENRVVVRSYSYVPDGYEIVKAGVVATLDADIANGTFDDQTATYPRAANVNGSSDNYYYTWSKSNITSEQTVYVKAYLIYKDADGVEHTIYGDLVTATLTE